jgi:hypothetical protein
MKDHFKCKMGNILNNNGTINYVVNVVTGVYHMFDNDPPLSEESKRWLRGDLTPEQHAWKESIINKRSS